MKRCRGGLLLAAAFGAAPMAAAQTPQQPQTAAAPQPRAGVQVFEPAFFARYNPVTAADMVRQAPGFSIADGEDVRGFGATAGNVLIDGARPSSKNSISEELERIPARAVARIELISAAAAGDIDVRGYTQLANVVLKPAAGMQVNTLWMGAVQYQQDARMGAQANATRQWKTDSLVVRLNGQLTTVGERTWTDVRITNPAGALTERRDEFEQQNYGELALNGTMTWQASARDTVSVTGRLAPRLFQIDAGSQAYGPTGAPGAVLALDYTEKDILHSELGGDWEHRFSPQNSVKLISVNRQVVWRPQQLFEEHPLTGPQRYTRVVSDMRAGEHVLRGVWTLKPSAQHTVEMGLEGAYNYRDTDRQYYFGTAGRSGPFAPIAVPGASSEVEELRGEASITDTWLISPQLTLESGFTFEASRIESRSPDLGDSEKELTFPKPRLVLTWAPNPKEQWRATLKREVGQLDLEAFASSQNFFSNQFTVGNAIEPEQTTEARLEWRRTFGQRGSIVLQAFYNEVDDVLDFVPVAGGTAVGNIGSGKRWGGSADITAPLDGFGLKGAILKAGVEARDSEVTDPTTGETRSFGGEADYGWRLEFRQDVPDLKLAWGGDYNSDGPERTFRVNEVARYDPGEGDLDLFVETTRWMGVTMRLQADNVFDQEEPTERRFFSPTRAAPGVFVGQEVRTATERAKITFIVTGAF